MPRQVRIQYPGAIYHIMSRGNRRQEIYLDDVDRQDFLKTLAEACQKTGWQVHAYCLMSNHYHLVAETPNANLVAGMAWLQSAYTIRLNHRHKLIGHVLSGRYKAQLVEGSGTGYLRTACDYVHLNPVRAGLLTPEQPLQSYPWTSYPLYLLVPERRPPWVRTDRLLGEWGIPTDSPAGREQFAVRMEARRTAELTGDFQEMPRGWCLGSEEFRQELLLQMTTMQGSKFAGPEWKETGQKKAEGIVAEELQRRGWSNAVLGQLHKADPQKLAIARRLRAETTVTFRWIADHLRMGAAGYLSNCLRTTKQ